MKHAMRNAKVGAAFEGQPTLLTNFVVQNCYHCQCECKNNNNPHLVIDRRPECTRDVEEKKTSLNVKFNVYNSASYEAKKSATTTSATAAKHSNKEDIRPMDRLRVLSLCVQKCEFGQAIPE